MNPDFQHHKTCPWCKCEPALKVARNYRYQPSFYIECSNKECPTAPITNMHQSVDEAWAAWDQRQKGLNDE